MDQDAIIQYVADTFEGVDILRPDDGPGAGDTFFIYDPDRNLDDKHRFPFATIVTKDYGDFAKPSNLNRPDVFRLNVGLSRDTFRALFPDSTTQYDYAVLDQLMPHPAYASQSYVCVLNPSEATFEKVKPLLAEAYARASNRIAGSQARAG